mmetsp:Transcript_41440/g.137806  ORF Transcript_41440/g.137806 Transcript_41440/m.137806 type:complete len:272 (-) Transcript_41440:609-1424(-)
MAARSDASRRWRSKSEAEQRRASGHRSSAAHSWAAATTVTSGAAPSTLDSRRDSGASRAPHRSRCDQRAVAPSIEAARERSRRSTRSSAALPAVRSESSKRPTSSCVVSRGLDPDLGLDGSCGEVLRSPLAPPPGGDGCAACSRPGARAARTGPPPSGPGGASAWAPRVAAPSSSRHPTGKTERKAPGKLARSASAWCGTMAGVRCWQGPRRKGWWSSAGYERRRRGSLVSRPSRSEPKGSEAFSGRDTSFETIIETSAKKLWVSNGGRPM